MKLVELSFEQYYLPGKPVLPLLALCECASTGEILRACITDQCESLQNLVEQGGALASIAETLGVAVLDFSQALQLQPVFIPKPWGQEIWFTGIEARGVSQVVSATGVTPLPWVLALYQQQILGSHTQLNLLKILDPLPDEVFGDLYFELHEQKREVYIVTHVDRSAWPDGVGAIRYGFASEKRQLFADDAAFLAAYRDAVRDYETVRRAIDAELELFRERDGFSPSAPVGAQQMKQWLAHLPSVQREQEAALRKTMESFTALRPLRVGDVLAVPLRTPHALQHGVRTVEFQTPVYERKILSFAQKVLTQDGWDTDDALRLATLDTPQDQRFPVLQQTEGVLLEQVVAFDDFIVQRLSLASSATFACETAGSYVLLMTVAGRVVCATRVLEAEQACLVPACLSALAVQNPFSEPAVLLLARPVLAG
ncbi:MAG: hypothetical protein IT470_02165 [Pseudomonadales bacterium]|nr:hypothetical protein [Pseudomonadales bacterium]